MLGQLFSNSLRFTHTHQSSHAHTRPRVHAIRPNAISFQAQIHHHRRRRKPIHKPQQPQQQQQQHHDDGLHQVIHGKLDGLDPGQLFLGARFPAWREHGRRAAVLGQSPPREQHRASHLVPPARAQRYRRDARAVCPPRGLRRGTLLQLFYFFFFCFSYRTFLLFRRGGGVPCALE